MKSFRRTQVFIANIAKTASVINRTRSSLKVANASAANAAYAANAKINLLFTTASRRSRAKSARDFGCGHAASLRAPAYLHSASLSQRD
jgi:hypothetical protein